MRRRKVTINAVSAARSAAHATPEPASPSWQDHLMHAEWNDLMQDQTKKGSKNPHSVCYRNAVFQMLAHTSILMHWVEWYRFNHVPAEQVCTLGKKNGRCKICLLYDVLLTFWHCEAGGCEATVTALWDRIFPDWNKGKMFGEQDAAEFWSELYRQLYEDTRPIFQGDLQRICRLSTVTMIECHGPNACTTRSYRPDEADFLCARFPEESANNDTPSVRDAIDQYFAESAIEGSVCNECQNPRFHSERLANPPEYLLVKLNRIEYVKGLSGLEVKKLHREIDSVDRLTLSAGLFDPRPDREWTDSEYELSAVVLHHGDDIKNGHFYAIVKDRGGKWTVASDATLLSGTWDQFATSERVKDNAYIFAYCRVPAKPAHTQLPEPPKDIPVASQGVVKKLTPQPDPLTERRRPMSARDIKTSVLEYYQARLEPIEECSEPSTGSFRRSSKGSSKGSSYEVQEAIEGLKTLKSTLANISTVSEDSEVPEALKAEYWRAREDFLNQLGAGSHEDAETRRKLAEDVAFNVREQLGRLTGEPRRYRQSSGYASETPSDDVVEMSKTPHLRRKFRQKVGDKMRGLVDIMFTPSGSDEPAIHGRIQGMFRNVVESDDSKGVMEGRTKSKRNQSKSQPKDDKTSPPKATNRVTRGNAKRQAEEKIEKPGAAKRLRRG